MHPLKSIGKLYFIIIKTVPKSNPNLFHSSRALGVGLVLSAGLDSWPFPSSLDFETFEAEEGIGSGLWLELTLEAIVRKSKECAGNASVDGLLNNYGPW